MLTARSVQIGAGVTRRLDLKRVTAPPSLDAAASLSTESRCRSEVAIASALSSDVRRWSCPSGRTDPRCRAGRDQRRRPAGATGRRSAGRQAAWRLTGGATRPAEPRPSGST
jgi:hypothetical protein